MRYIGGFGLLVASVVFCVYTVQLPAKTIPDNSPLAILRQFPKPEFPAEAVALVQAATNDEKISVLTNTLWAVGGLARPGVMPYVVSALCRENTNLADTVVGTVLEMNGAPVMNVITVALKAAPGMADKIMRAAFVAKPTAISEIAMAVIFRGASTSTNILRNLCEALPPLGPYVDTAMVQAADVMADENYRAATNLAAQATADLPDQPEATEENGLDRAAQTLAELDEQIRTNQDFRHLYLVVGYANYAITNAGLTIEDLLTNGTATGDQLTNVVNAAGTNTFTGTPISGTNGIPPVNFGVPAPVTTNLHLNPPPAQP